jgi:hypothetical protein
MKKTLTIVASFILLASCYNDKYDKLYPAPATPVTCDTATISYATDIAPIINTSCAINGGCHNASGNSSTGNLDFTVFATLQSQATAAVLLNDIYFTPTRGHNNMPLNLPQLSACDQKKLTKWVNAGAPNN